MLTKKMNRFVGKAMHSYDMLQDGDRVLIAVSGGIDSLILAWLLHMWRQKAPIHFDLTCVHIDMGHSDNQSGPAALEVRNILDSQDMQSVIIPAAWQPSQTIDLDDDPQKDVCFTCSRSRRKQLFDYARQENYTKIALGHHRDDLIETFFLNICFAGNISTMLPRQDLFEGRLALIRPLAYLEKKDIIQLGEKLKLQPVRTPCPASEITKRGDIRDFLENDLYQKFPGAKSRIFSALSHVRQDYLLKQDHNAL